MKSKSSNFISIKKRDVSEIIPLIEKIIEKNYDKETFRISAYWDLRDDINLFWPIVEMFKEVDKYGRKLLIENELIKQKLGE